MKRTLEQLCTDIGLRMTRQRRTIIQAIENASDHPDAWSIYLRAGKADPQICLSTVYRTLRIFQNAGILAGHRFKDGLHRFERDSDERHGHLIDRTTGKIIEFRDREIERLQSAIAEHHGYRLVGYRLELIATPLTLKETAKGREDRVG
ncbi:MAG: transcriptional repressor [Alphaproteobacteria bacterium]|nr:transcriptional repressor [Alphaproteobacteria bacterium]